jgi:hypothetical protein
VDHEQLKADAAGSTRSRIELAASAELDEGMQNLSLKLGRRRANLAGVLALSVPAAE